MSVLDCPHKGGCNHPAHCIAELTCQHLCMPKPLLGLPTDPRLFSSVGKWLHSQGLLLPDRRYHLPEVT